MSQVMMDEGSGQVGRWLRRYAALVLAFALVGGGAAAAYGSTLSESYSSSARVLIRPSVGNPFSPDTGSSSQQVTIAVATEAALVDSDAVLALASDSTGNAVVAADVSATVPPNTSTIVTTVRGSSAAEAQENAQSVSEAFLQYRETVTERSQSQSGDQLRSQISAVQESLTQGDPESAAVARRSDVLTSQLVSLQSSLVQIQAITTDPGTLVTPASPGVKSGISTVILVVAGVVGGLLVGALVAFALGRRDKRIHARSDSAVAGVPVLAVLGGGRGEKDAGATASSDKQAFQRMRTFILASSALPSAVAISGVGPEEGSGEVALGLGQSMARAGYRVAVVLASPLESGPFENRTQSGRGLAEALRGGDVLDLMVEQDGMKVLNPGSGIVAEQEMLSGRRFKTIVDTLKGSFDYILVVTGPASLPAEFATARMADVLLLVAKDGETSGPQVRDVVSRAALVGLPVSGLALQAGHSRGSGKGRAGVDSSSSDGEGSTVRKASPEDSTTPRSAEDGPVPADDEPSVPRR